MQTCDCAAGRVGSQTCSSDGSFGACVCDGRDITDQFDCDDPALFYLDEDGDGFGIDGDSQRACEAPTGFAAAAGDCNDDDDTIHPNAGERCDEVDHNCDDELELEAIDAVEYFVDEDRDSFGLADSGVFSCDVIEDMALNGDDCDDTNDSIHPAADEVCDERDNDCDGRTDDEDDDVEGAPTYYVDADDDGFAAEGATALSICEPPKFYAEEFGDCDDEEEGINPDADELCDDIDWNCDEDPTFDAANGPWEIELEDGSIVNSCTDPGDPDEHVDPCEGLEMLTWYNDEGDSDGWGDSRLTEEDCVEPEEGEWVDQGGDCAPTDEEVNPGADEICGDDINNDCDEDGADEGCDPCEGLTRYDWYYNGEDDDEYGHDYGDDHEYAPINDCFSPGDDWVTQGGDCAPTDSAIYPGATEICDGIINNCDLTDADEGLDTFTWYYNGEDSDEFGSDYGYSVGDEHEWAPVESCSAPGDDWVTDGGDCEPTMSDVHPDADEICDGINNDCDEDGIDEGYFRYTWYYNGEDTDRYGSDYGHSVGDEHEWAPVENCRAPSADWVTDGGDCDPADATVFPGAEEVCDGKKNDCDLSFADEGLRVATYYYNGEDDDNFGYDYSADLGSDHEWAATTDCKSPGPDWVTDGGDCDPEDGSIYPGAEEVCDGVINNCNLSSADEGLDFFTWYYNGGDDDGYGSDYGYSVGDDNPLAPVYDCTSPEGDWVQEGDDCVPDDNTVHPNAEEICDGKDNDCDTETPADEGCVTEHCPEGGSEAVISASETWTTTYPHVVSCDLYIEGSSVPTVTIDPNAVVHFAEDVGIFVGVRNDGALRVAATEGNEVLFTSDDTDTPAPGDWEGLVFGPFDQSSVAYLQIEYAGAERTPSGSGPTGVGAIRVEGDGGRVPTPRISYSQVTNSASNGVWVDRARPNLSHSRIANNAADGLYCYRSPCLDETYPGFDSNTVESNLGYALSLMPEDVNGLSSVGSYGPNGVNYVRIKEDDYSYNAWVRRSVSWPHITDPDADTPTIAYYLEDFDGVARESSGRPIPVLTIEEGVRVEAAADVRVAVGLSEAGDLVVMGGFDGAAEGDDPLGVTFTSNAAEPEPGDWYGFFLGEYISETSDVDGLFVEFAGGGTRGYNNEPAGLVIHDSSGLEISNSTFSNNFGHGVWLADAHVSFTGSTFENNTQIGLYIPWSSNFQSSIIDPFDDNTFVNNGENGLWIPVDQIELLEVTNSIYGPNTLDWIQGDDIDNRDITGTDVHWYAPLDNVGDVVPYGFTSQLGIAAPFESEAMAKLTIHDNVEMWLEGAVLLGWSNSRGQLVIQGDRTDGIDVHLDAFPDDIENGEYWTGIEINENSGAVDLAGFTIAHAGWGGEHSGGIRFINEPDPEVVHSISDCVIRDTQGAGVYANQWTGSLDIDDCDFLDLIAAYETAPASGIGVEVFANAAWTTGDPGFLSVTNSHFEGNAGYPMFLHVDSLGGVGSSNTFVAPTTADSNVVYVQSRTIGRDATWSPIAVPYRFQAQGPVAREYRLTMAGTSDSELRIELPNNGAIEMGGTSAGIIEMNYTRVRSYPRSEFWSTVYVRSNATSDNSITNSTFDSGGRGTNNGAIRLDSTADVTITGNTFVAPQTCAFYLYNDDERDTQLLEDNPRVGDLAFEKQFCWH